MRGHFKVITVSRNWTVTAASNEDNFIKTAKVIRETPLTRIQVQVNLFMEPSYPADFFTSIKYLSDGLRIKSVTPFNSFVSKFLAQNLNFALNGYLSGKVNFLFLRKMSLPELVIFHLHNSGPS